MALCCETQIGLLYTWNMLYLAFVARFRLLFQQEPQSESPLNWTEEMID
ncbi:hypothetical protein Osc7112_3020 [Oscillatoria nigro-viridis PCC 7112]|uniref:Uncharacterized protein n=1 Tax=Phormidium nigroviride PCC 7112 TaxID=179408 RepID=K9VHH9_9CYAN|nr:hypothetical protein Osc7112_3020 [Oscillatoria nigro-viridis PCC 7112]